MLWCEAERSFSSEARHLAINSYGVMGGFSVADDGPRLLRDRIRRPEMAETASGVTLDVAFRRKNFDGSDRPGRCNWALLSACGGSEGPAFSFTWFVVLPGRGYCLGSSDRLPRWAD